MPRPPFIKRTKFLWVVASLFYAAVIWITLGRPGAQHPKHLAADKLLISEEPYHSIVDAEWSRARVILHLTGQPKVQWDSTLSSRNCLGETKPPPAPIWKYLPKWMAPVVSVHASYATVRMDPRTTTKSPHLFVHVLRHEFAHIATPGTGHGAEWERALHLLGEAEPGRQNF